MDRIGPYEIIDRIGTGGMGTVYRARHTETGEVVALKVLRSDFVDDSLFLRRFRREAEIARSLESEHIVRTLDAGVDDGTPWIAMELVEGESLAAVLRRRGALPADQAVDIALQVAEGLAVADQSGVVHRDISPQNILITNDGTAKLADFGVARSETSDTLTATAAFIGKPAYAAPEVFSGQADIRSDIYSLGAVLFEMLTGRAVFIAASPMALMEMHQTQTPPTITDLGVRVSPQLEAAVQRCLEKEPGRRYQTPGELAGALSGRTPLAEVTTVVPDAPAIGETVTMRSGGREPPRDSRVTARGGCWRERWWMLAVTVVAGLSLTVAVFVIASAAGPPDDDKQGLASPPPIALEPSQTSTPATTAAPTPVAEESIPAAWYAPSGYPVDPTAQTLRVTGAPGSRTLTAGGPTVGETSELLQLNGDADTANSSGWNCATHVRDQGQPAADWYLPKGTPAIATMDGTATLYVISTANTFAYYGVNQEPYLGNPTTTKDAFSGQPNGGKGVYVEILSERFMVNFAHLDIGRTIEAIPEDTFLPGFSRTYDYASTFGVPRAYTDRTAVALWSVRRGDTIGYTGDSGYAEAPQTHYEILRAGSTSKLCPTAEPGFSDGGWLANTDPNRP